MTKLLWLIPVIFLAPWIMQSQQPGAPAFHYVTTLPTGSCVGTPPIQINYFTGQAVVCANGTWTPLGGTGAGSGNITGTLTPGTLVDATGAQTIASSIGTDNGVTLNYPGTGGVVSPLLTMGTVSSGRYALLSLSDGNGPYTSLQLFDTCNNCGTTVDSTGVYAPNFQTGGNTLTGTLVVSGPATVGTFQNGDPGVPIYVNQNGGSAVALQVNGGLTGMNLKATVYTLASGSSHIPAASSVAAGTMVEVSDSTSYTAGACGAGGGSDYQIAISSGSAWSCH